MSSTSSIEWTDATWNPVRGCSIVSKGCTNCYAMKQAHRFSGPGRAYEGLTTLTKGGPVWTGKVTTHPELLNEPLRWKQPRRVFVNSMSDLFHHDVDDAFIARVFAIMARCPKHTFQILTKRPARMLELMTRKGPAAFWIDVDNILDHYFVDMRGWPLPNVWLGVSAEDQAAADERIPLLMQTPAAVRWISAEPLLGPLDVRRWFQQTACDRCTQGVMDAGNVHMRGGCPCACHVDEIRPNWVVAGGESGPGARAMDPRWARALRDQCAAAFVPFFFKQWGEWAPEPTTLHPHRRVGKKRAGRILDGRTYDEYPA